MEKSALDVVLAFGNCLACRLISAHHISAAPEM
jgi:hypothetical protein